MKYIYSILALMVLFSGAMAISSVCDYLKFPFIGTLVCMMAWGHYWARWSVAARPVKDEETH